MMASPTRLGNFLSTFTMVTILALAATGVPQEADLEILEPARLEQISWRSIGPSNMGGRMTDIEGVPGKPYILYFGTASSGLWKTVNGAISSEPIFDDQPVHSIGDIALDPNNPEVLWVGTGEDNPRNTVSFGNGLYKSPDGGENWFHVGLEATRHIARVIVHPRDSDTVYVAAMGHAFAPNEDRGVFMTTDGGKTWEKVLYIDEETGASDLEMDPTNSNILYAGMWTFMRQPWAMTSGSETGGLYKSVDGGRTWNKLTEGLPELMGRIGVKVAPTNPQIVYAIAETKEGTLFRSEDRGESFKKIYDKPDILSRGFYFAEMRIDPKNENRIYAVSGRLSVSTDGGRSFSQIGGKLHGDHHTLWIDPVNPNILVDGNDGGIGISRDYGKLWEYVRNIPLGQYYQIAVDNQVPFYMVYGGLQDNGSWGTPGRSRHRFGISNDELISIGGGDGFYAAVHPGEPHRILSDSQNGNIVRFDTRTGQSQRISPYPGGIVSGAPASEHEFRFDWNTPIVLSPHDPEIAYLGGNVLFRSSNFGTSWKAISPDLTTNDAEKLQSSGGPIRADNTTAEYHCVIVSVSESPIQSGLIWIGTDDTQIQLTRDGGTSWENLSANVTGLPTEAVISHVEASNDLEGRAYVTADRHQLDDFKPYVFKTEDFGETWTNITGNLPTDGYVHVIREDPTNPQLLYVGTEIGVYVSIRGGDTWFPLRMKNLPAAIAVRDLLIHPEEDDLILGTHGRSIWILDDIGFLRQISSEISRSDIHLFKPRRTWRYSFWTGDTGGTVWGGDKNFWGPNPDYGALLTYYLKEAPEEDTEAKIEIMDAQANLVREIKATKEPGLNRVAWDLRYEAPEKRKVDTEEEQASAQPKRNPSPQVVPGEYTVRLAMGDQTLTETVQVALEPSVYVSTVDLELQLKTALELRDLISSLNLALRSLDRVEQQIKDIQKTLETAMESAPEEVESSLSDLLKKVEEQKKTMARDQSAGYSSPTQLLGKLSGWLSGITRTEAAPTAHQIDYFDKLRAEHQEALQKTDGILKGEIAALNEVLNQYNLPIVYVGKS